MKAITLIAAAIGAAFALPFTASAAGDNTVKPEPAGDSLFKRLDVNKDGYVTRDEARDAPELQGRFAELDVNNDGKISRQEMQALNAKESATGGSSARGDSPKTGKAR